MITWREGTVVSLGRRWTGAVELDVRLTEPLPGSEPAGNDPKDSAGSPDTLVRGLAYPTLVGEPRPGDRVLLNVSAQARGLGTGGYALVVAIPDRLPADPPAGPGHIVKARYTPLQTMVLGVDEQESVHHAALAAADDLEGLPVVVAGLHSALPAVLAGARQAAERAGRAVPRAAYVMTDGGALPAWFSRSLAALRDAGWLEACITVGQAFGGDLEAVTVHTGLLAAHAVCEADLVVVAQGPGNLGTGTRWGFSGVAAGEAVNAVGALGGQPVAALRVSGADARDRHRGVSHHTLTALGRVALHPADVVVPVLSDPAAEDAPLLARIAYQADELTAARHRRVDVEVTQELRDSLTSTPVRLSTMGRGPAEDPWAFLASAAAGAHAQGLRR